MWIKTSAGSYVNSAYAMQFYFTPSKFGGYVIGANINGDSRPVTIAQFNDKEDAQKYLDRLVKAYGERIFEVSMEDWNYTGHKKDHKETRHGGS